MEIYVLDSSRNMKGVIDQYQSFIWTERFYEAGDCELYIQGTPENLDLLKRGYFLTKSVDGTLCRITSVEVRTDANNGTWLLVKGKDARDILNQRVYIQRTYTAVYATSTINAIIKKNAGSDAASSRQIPGLVINTSIGRSDLYYTTDTFFYCFDKIVEICRQFGYGSKMYWTTDKSLVFTLYLGTDRTASQNTYPRVIFSDAMNNLSSSVYTEDYTTYKNYAYVAGEGEGWQRYLTNTGSGSGLNRYEIFVDASSVSKQPDGDEQPLTTEEYAQVLQEYAKDELTKHKVGVTFNGTISEQLYKYGVDYNLGDLVTIQNSLGVGYDARITEVIESDDIQHGHIYIPKFEYI